MHGPQRYEHEQVASCCHHHPHPTPCYLATEQPRSLQHQHCRFPGTPLLEAKPFCARHLRASANGISAWRRLVELHESRIRERGERRCALGWLTSSCALSAPTDGTAQHHTRQLTAQTEPPHTASFSHRAAVGDSYRMPSSSVVYLNVKKGVRVLDDRSGEALGTGAGLRRKNPGCDSHEEMVRAHESESQVAQARHAREGVVAREKGRKRTYVRPPRAPRPPPRHRRWAPRLLELRAAPQRRAAR